MTTLLRSPAPVHSNPPYPGPRLGKVGISLGYPHCNIAEAAEYYAAHGTTAGCCVVELEDVTELDAACEADAPRRPFADWIASQADGFRDQDTAAARWLAAELDELADLARTLHAATVEQFDDRRDALNDCCDRDPVQGLSYADIVL